MSEMASLMAITRNSTEAFWKHKRLWWFSVPIGILIGLGSLAPASFQDRLPDTSDISSWSLLLSSSGLLTAIAISFAIMLSQSVLRGALIALFADQMSESLEGARGTRTVPWKNMLRFGYTSLHIEIFYWVALGAIGIAVITPSILAQHYNPSIMPTVFELGFLLLITIGVYLYFVKELSCLYAILGKINLRSAGDLGFRLFRKQAFNTVLFFFYAALLTLFFSLLIDLVSRAFPSFPNAKPFVPSILAAIPFGLYFVFDQILRIFFFRSIAVSPKKPVVKEVTLEPSQTPSGASQG